MYKQRLVVKYDATRSFPLVAKIEYLLEHSDLVEFAKTRECILKEGDVIYALPDVGIPRFKLKMGCDKKGVTVTRSSEKADYIIINKLDKDKSHTTLSNQEVTYYRFVKLTDYIDTLLTNYASNVYSKEDRELTKQYAELVQSIKGVVQDSIDVIISSDDLQEYIQFARDNFGKYIWAGYFPKLNFLSLKKPSLVSKLRYQDTIVTQINEDSIIITDQKMNELQAMFDSKDTGNIVLAMEMMANSNYIESILNLYTLLLKNLRIISEQKESTHKNFQNMMEFFGKKLKYMNTHIQNSEVDYIAGFLKKYNKLTQESMERLLMYYADTHTQFIGKYCNSILVSNPDVNFD
jgi:hypothetical protein